MDDVLNDLDVEGVYVGGGLGINIVSWEYPEPNILAGTIGTGSESELRIGIGALAGYELPLDDYTAFGQLKYNIISDLNTLELAVGVYFDMSKF
jgi:hypothetical protein